MDFYLGQILLLSLLLATIPAVTLGYLLDLRRLRKTKQHISPILSRNEILGLTISWILGGIFLWNIVIREELHISYAISAIAMVSFLIISKTKRETLTIVKGLRWYVWLIITMIVATFVGVIIRSEFLVILGGIALVIIIAYDRWSRLLGL